MIWVYCTARTTYITGYEMIWVYCTACVTYITGYEMIWVYCDVTGYEMIGFIVQPAQRTSLATK